MRLLRGVGTCSTLAIVCAAVASSVLCCAGPATAAALQVDAVDPIVQVGSGDSARVMITIRNAGSQPVHVNGVAATLDPGFDLGAPFDSFLQLAPEVLGTDEAWMGTAMSFLVPPETPVGEFDFTVLLQGGATATDSAWVGSVSVRLAIVHSECLPIVNTAPAPLDVTPGADATFTVNAQSASTPGYRWRLDGIELADDARVSGSGSSSLHIATVGAADAGNYDVRITNDCGASVSSPAALRVEGTGAVGPGSTGESFGLSFTNPLRSWDQVQWSAPAGPVQLTLHDVAGRRIGVLLDEQVSAGVHRLGSSAGIGKLNLGNGVYYLTLTTRGQTIARKVVVLSR